MFDRAMFAYTANEVDELNLNKGDYVVVHHASDDGWYTGLNVSTGKLGSSVHELQNLSDNQTHDSHFVCSLFLLMSRTGTFPGNFVARADVHGTDSDAELARQLQAIEVEHAAQDLDTASDEVIARSMQLQEEERVCYH
jgi:hypothetical protein